MIKKILFILSLLALNIDANAMVVERSVIQTQSGQQCIFDTEVARTNQEQSTGLMYRTVLPQNHGMLFIYPFPKPITMWMKNCYVPLDMIFIDATGRICHIVKHTIPNSPNHIYSNCMAKSVLEIGAGLTSAYNINVGDKLIAPILR